MANPPLGDPKKGRSSYGKLCLDTINYIQHSLRRSAVSRGGGQSSRTRARVSTSSEWWRGYRPSAAQLAERVRQLEAELEAPRSGASVSEPAASEPPPRVRASREAWPLRPQWWAGYSPSATQLFDLIADLEAEIERLRSGKTEGKQGGPGKMGSTRPIVLLPANPNRT